jgi:hypothetical protein
MALNKQSDLTETFPPWKGGTKAYGVPVCWMIIDGPLEETYYRKNIAESHLLLLFK